METRVGSQPAADLRDYLVEERTFLAWIRTGVALMTFGFVVARFGIFLAEFQLIRDSAAVAPHRFSLWAGTALMAVGVAMNLWSIRRHLRVIEQLDHGRFDRGPSYQAVGLALFLALAGVAAALYLILA
jgi:putative membrane protein